jgi:hypothetical protein
VRETRLQPFPAGGPPLGPRVPLPVLVGAVVALGSYWLFRSGEYEPASSAILWRAGLGLVCALLSLLRPPIRALVVFAAMLVGIVLRQASVGLASVLALLGVTLAPSIHTWSVARAHDALTRLMALGAGCLAAQIIGVPLLGLCVKDSWMPLDTVGFSPAAAIGGVVALIWAGWHDRKVTAWLDTVRAARLDGWSVSPTTGPPNARPLMLEGFSAVHQTAATLRWSLQGYRDQPLDVASVRARASPWWVATLAGFLRGAAGGTAPLTLVLTIHLLAHEVAWATADAPVIGWCAAWLVARRYYRGRWM